MQVQKLGSTPAMVKYRINGITCFSIPGSVLERVIRALRDREVFTTREISQDTGISIQRVTEACHRLWKKGVLHRSRFKASIIPNVKEYIYYEPGKDFLVVEYLLGCLEDDRLRGIILDIMQEERVFSSARLIEEYGLPSLNPLFDFMKAGAIMARKERVYDGKKPVTVWIFYSPQMQERDVEELVNAELEYVRDRLKRAGGDGRRFEEMVARFFQVAAERGDLILKPEVVKRRVYRKLPSGSNCEIDVVVKFRLYLGDKPFGYSYGDGVVLAVSCKNRGGYGAHVNEIFINACETFNSVLPGLVSPMVSRSTFDEAERRGVVLFPKKFIRIMEDYLSSAENTDAKIEEIGRVKKMEVMSDVSVQERGTI
jgi:hypothetical protein